MSLHQIGEKIIGHDHPVFIVAEVGINHNGEISTAKRLIDAAVEAGCNAVKFQKRSPDICVPEKQRLVMRDTPWGRMTYIDYRHRMEFGDPEYEEIDQYCRKRGITWFASCWDRVSVDFIDRFDPVCYKIASACLTDNELLRYTRIKGKPMVLSTGMSTMDEVRNAVSILGQGNLLIAHTTSSYKFNPNEINLKVIDTFRKEFTCPVGYSGHEVGYTATIAAVAMGAAFVERHITLDRTLWGSDHQISLEPLEFKKMVEDIRIVEAALGDGVKRIFESERSVSAKLRKCGSSCG